MADDLSSKSLMLLSFRRTTNPDQPSLLKRSNPPTQKIHPSFKANSSLQSNSQHTNQGPNRTVLSLVRARSEANQSEPNLWSRHLPLCCWIKELLPCLSPSAQVR